MVIEVNYGQVLGRPAEDLTNFAEATKVLPDRVLLVEGWRHIPALDGGAVCGRHAAQALRALPAYPAFHWGCDLQLRVRGFCRVYRGTTGNRQTTG